MAQYNPRLAARGGRDLVQPDNIQPMAMARLYNDPTQRWTGCTTGLYRVATTNATQATASTITPAPSARRPRL